MEWIELDGRSPAKPGSSNNNLSAVSCYSENSCLAIGSMSHSGITYQTLAEVWNGESWTVIPSASPSTTQNDLAQASCTGTATCQAVGSSADGASTNHTLVEDEISS